MLKIHAGYQSRLVPAPAPAIIAPLFRNFWRAWSRTTVRNVATILHTTRPSAIGKSMSRVRVYSGADWHMTRKRRWDMTDLRCCILHGKRTHERQGPGDPDLGSDANKDGDTVDFTKSSRYGTQAAAGIGIKSGRWPLVRAVHVRSFLTSAQAKCPPDTSSSAYFSRSSESGASIFPTATSPDLAACFPAVETTSPAVIPLTTDSWLWVVQRWTGWLHPSLKMTRRR